MSFAPTDWQRRVQIHNHVPQRLKLNSGNPIVTLNNQYLDTTCRSITIQLLKSQIFILCVKDLDIHSGGLTQSLLMSFMMPREQINQAVICLLGCIYNYTSMYLL